MRRGRTGVTILRKVGSANGFQLCLTIPADLSRALVAAGKEGAPFVCVLTDEGILFRPAEVVEDAPLPAWAENGKRA